MNEFTLTYPVEVRCKDGMAAVRPMEPSDQEAAIAFARGLPSHDLLFMRPYGMPEALER